jgi:hypothetical protein
MQSRKCILITGCLMAIAGSLAAQDITGLWKGTLYNDTTGKYLRYEVAISESRGKLFGYSHTFFIVDDREYYGVKRVTVRKEEDKVIVQDEKLIANNYPIPPAKGVYQLNVLTLQVQDSNMVLSGPFSTNRTKEYHPLTGSIRIQRKSDYMQSALVPHLEELGLADDLSFVLADKRKKTKPEESSESDLARTKPGKKEKPVKETQPVALKTRPAKQRRSRLFRAPSPQPLPFLFRQSPLRICPAGQSKPSSRYSSNQTALYSPCTTMVKWTGIP